MSLIQQSLAPASRTSLSPGVVSTAYETRTRKKKNTKKRAGRVTQVVEHLPSKSEALSSSPSTAKKKRKQTI
jgi:hypothetical protein